jgi:hypothetical protein
MLNLFLPFLTILFIWMKLTGQIDWTWAWVLSPMLIPCGLWACGLLATLILGIHQSLKGK